MLELECSTCICECSAITEYIDAIFEGTPLTGTSPKETAAVHRCSVVQCKMFWMRWATTFHHATEGLGPDLETNQFPSWGESQRDKALDGMAYFDSVLKQLSCVAGDLFSMVDITLFAGLGYHDFVKIDIPAELDSLTTWRERIAQRPSIAG